MMDYMGDLVEQATADQRIISDVVMDDTSSYTLHEVLSIITDVIFYPVSFSSKILTAML